MAAFAIAAAAGARSFYDPDPVRQHAPRPRCPYCSCRMTKPSSVSRNRRMSDSTRDHIRPRAWQGDDDPSNIRRCCHACNQLRAECGHCIGAMACVRVLARETGRSPRLVIRSWGLAFRHFQSFRFGEARNA